VRKYILGGIAVVLMIPVTIYVLFYANIEYLIYRIDEYRYERMYNIAEGEIINLQLYGIFEVDTIGLRKEVGVVEGVPFTYFFQPHTLNSWKSHSNYGERHFDFSELDFDETDFQDRFLAISFGREIAEIRRAGSFYFGLLNVAVTFAEEYEGDVMFLYTMDKVELPFCGAEYIEFYVMDGDERVFIGKSVISLNQWDK